MTTLATSQLQSSPARDELSTRQSHFETRIINFLDTVTNHTQEEAEKFVGEMAQLFAALRRANPPRRLSPLHATALKFAKVTSNAALPLHLADWEGVRSSVAALASPAPSAISPPVSIPVSTPMIQATAPVLQLQSIICAPENSQRGFTNTVPQTTAVTRVETSLAPTPYPTLPEDKSLPTKEQDIPTIEILDDQTTKSKVMGIKRDLTTMQADKPAKRPYKRRKSRERLVSKVDEVNTTEVDELSLSETDIQHVLFGPCEKCVGRETPCTTDKLGPRHTTCDYCKIQKLKCSISNPRSVYFRSTQGKIWLKEKSSHGVKRKAEERQEAPSPKRRQVLESHSSSPPKASTSVASGISGTAIPTLKPTVAIKSSPVAKPRTVRGALGAAKTKKKTTLEVKPERKSPSVESDKGEVTLTNNTKVEAREPFDKYTTPEWREYQALTTDEARFEHLGFFLTRRGAEYQNFLENFARFKKETEGKFLTMKIAVDQEHQIELEEVAKLREEMRKGFEAVREDIGSLFKGQDKTEVAISTLKSHNQELKDHVLILEKQLKDVTQAVSSSVASNTTRASRAISTRQSLAKYISLTPLKSGTILPAQNRTTAVTVDESLDSSPEESLDVSEPETRSQCADISHQTSTSTPTLSNPAEDHVMRTNDAEQVTVIQESTEADTSYNTYVTNALAPMAPASPTNIANPLMPLNDSNGTTNPTPGANIAPATTTLNSILQDVEITEDMTLANDTIP